MNGTPRLEYFGDTAKAAELKGKALGFYQFVILSMGGVRTVQREKQVGDAVIRVQAWHDAYDVVSGVIQIYTPAIGANDLYGMFCTSFNDTDNGTQIYKNTYPPKTQGSLIAADNNPDNLPLPSPTYSVLNNYWYDSKQKLSISWDYVNFYGMLSVSGLYAIIGNGIKPLCAGLINNNTAAVIYEHDFNTYYAQYLLSITNGIMTASETINIFIASKSSDRKYELGGFFNDECLCAAFVDNSVDPQKINYTSFSYTDDSHSSVQIDSLTTLIEELNNGVVFSAFCGVFASGAGLSYAYTYHYNQLDFSLGMQPEGDPGAVEVIGNSANVDTKFQFFDNTLVLSNYYTYSGFFEIWQWGGFHSASFDITNNVMMPLFFSKDSMVIVYNKYQITQSLDEWIGRYPDIPYPSTTTTSFVNDFYINNINTLNRAANSPFSVDDVACTKSCLVIAVHANEAGDSPYSEKSIVMDIKNGNKKIIDNTLTNISVTNLLKRNG